MAVHKIVGLENEYGLAAFGFDAGHISARNANMDAIVGAVLERVRDIADGWRKDPSQVRIHLPNGGFTYRDTGAHPEYATPECVSVDQLVMHDRAGDRLFAQATRETLLDPQFASVFPDVDGLGIFKNNTDTRGHTYGTHENYAGAAEVTDVEYDQLLMPFLATRPLVAGSGGVVPDEAAPNGFRFILSPRAAHIASTFSVKSTSDRPMFNLRNEPLADRQRFRRVHLLCGDANRCDISTLLKVGTTAIVLAMIEDGFAPEDVTLEDSVSSLWATSADPTGRVLLRTDGHGLMSSLDVQYRYLEAAQEYAAAVGLEACGGPVAKDVLERWDAVLTAIDTDRTEELFGVIDWVTKRTLIDHKTDKLIDLGADAEMIKRSAQGVELSYANLDPASSPYEQLRARGRIATVGTSEPSITDPAPVGSRATVRAAVLRNWRASLLTMEWDGFTIEHQRAPIYYALPDALLEDGPQLARLDAYGDEPSFMVAFAKASPARMIAAARSTVNPFELKSFQQCLRNLIFEDDDPRYREALFEIGRSALVGIRDTVASERDPRFIEYCSLAQLSFEDAGCPEQFEIQIHLIRDHVDRELARIETTHARRLAPNLIRVGRGDADDSIETIVRRLDQGSAMLTLALEWKHHQPARQPYPQQETGSQTFDR